MSAKDLIGTIDPNVVKLWQRGLINCDPKMVADAISRGIDVETPCTSYDKEPALLGFMGRNEHYFSDAGSAILGVDVQARIKINSIIDLILAEDPDLLSKNDWGQTIADKALTTPNTEGATNVAIAAIHQSIKASQAPYEINFDAIFSGCGRDPTSAVRYERMQQIADNHSAIRERLLNPQNPIEIDLLRNHADKIGFWLNPLVPPDVKNLPYPPESLYIALDLMSKNLRGVEGECSPNGTISVLGREFLSGAKATSRRTTEIITKQTTDLSGLKGNSLE